MSLANLALRCRPCRIACLLPRVEREGCGRRTREKCAMPPPLLRDGSGEWRGEGGGARAIPACLSELWRQGGSRKEKSSIKIASMIQDWKRDTIVLLGSLFLRSEEGSFVLSPAGWRKSRKTCFWAGHTPRLRRRRTEKQLSHPPPPFTLAVLGR